MKILAYYLPQFHEVKENSLWWGSGFTEWNNVRKAKPLYKGHNQPRIPLNENYYDLSDLDALQWQSALLKKYNIYGLCYYHYWFKGRKILEKPAELLLRNSSIEQRFCFCWANHSWKRTWNKSNELLIEQGYGNESEWKEHLEYLIKFFRDPRYIKINNKPLFVVYNMSSISACAERFSFYDKFLKQNGFSGIELIQSVNTHSELPVQLDINNSSLALREPAFTHFSTESLYRKIERKIKSNKSFNLFKCPRIYSFQEISSKSIEFLNDSLGNLGEHKIYLGAFGGWDSTPRHGKHGYVITYPTMSEFTDYIINLNKIIASNDNVSDIVFYNAWNEWGEGCYLEPDIENGFSFLEVLSNFSK